MIFYNIEFPELLETTYQVDAEVHQRMIDTVMSQRDTANYHGGYTFHISDTHGDFKKLYTYFLKSVESITGPLELAPKNKSWCWANVYNKSNFKTNMHNHVGTSSINAIYYLKLPTGLAENEGGLIVVDKATDQSILYQPDEFDLLIMPSDIPHEPQYHSSDKYRIAINLEICTMAHISTYYTLRNIYANSQPRI